MRHARSTALVVHPVDEEDDVEIESGELCPSCGEVPLFHEEADGGEVECPNCGEIVVVNGGESADE